MGEDSGGLQDFNWGNMRNVQWARSIEYAWSKLHTPFILLDRATINSPDPFPPSASNIGTRKPVRT